MRRLKATTGAGHASGDAVIDRRAARTMLMMALARKLGLRRDAVISGTEEAAGGSKLLG
jgi:hypothetical protein